MKKLKKNEIPSTIFKVKKKINAKEIQEMKKLQKKISKEQKVMKKFRNDKNVKMKLKEI